MYLLGLIGTYKAFVRKFSVRAVSQVNFWQETYNQLYLITYVPYRKE